MGQIQFINEYSPNEEFTLDKRIRLLKARKLKQTEEKIEMEGGLDEDDYGRLLTRGFKECPYYKDGDEYKVVRHQM